MCGIPAKHTTADRDLARPFLTGQNTKRCKPIAKEQGLSSRSLSVRDEANNPCQYCSGDATAKQLTDNCTGIQTSRSTQVAWQERLQNLTSNATANCARNGVAQSAETHVLEATPGSFHRSLLRLFGLKD